MANGRVAEEILWRAADRCVTKFFEGEPFARILDAAGYCSTTTDEGYFHMLAGIEMCAMFHGIDQNLPECRYDLVFLSLGNARVSDAVQELNQAICGRKITSGRQAEPRGRPGKDFDAVVPTGLCHGRTHHFGDLRSFKWRREITEGSFAHGRNDVSWSKFIGEDDEADVRTSTPDLRRSSTSSATRVSRPVTIKSNGLALARARIC